MEFTPAELRKVAEEGFYTAVGISVATVMLARRRLRRPPPPDSLFETGEALLGEGLDALRRAGEWLSRRLG